MSKRRLLAALCAGGVLAAQFFLPAAAAAEADKQDNPAGCGANAVVAAAWGVQLTATRSDNILLSHPAGAGAPVAQACVDYGLRETMAFASSPYPGETLRTLPGTLGLPVSEYPAYAGSRHPSAPESRVDEPGMKLLARSSETASTGQAQSAVDPENDSGAASASAESSVDPAAGTSIATATADVRPLTVKDVLSLGEMVSVATAKHTKDGSIKRSSDLRIGHTTVGGQEVVITPRGVRAAGQTAAVPGTESVQEQLEKAGVKVRYVRAEETPGGILSAGVEISVLSEDPSGAKTALRYVLGRSFAAAAAVDDSAAPMPGGDGPAGSSGQAGSGNGPGPVASDEAPVEAEAPDASDAPAPEAAPPAPKVDPPQASQSVALAGKPADMGLGAAYLVIVLGALAMFVSGTLVRLLGVKTRWTS